MAESTAPLYIVLVFFFIDYRQKYGSVVHAGSSFDSL
jgi:hypothetical protein